MNPWSVIPCEYPIVIPLSHLSGSHLEDLEPVWPELPITGIQQCWIDDHPPICVCNLSLDFNYIYIYMHIHSYIYIYTHMYTHILSHHQILLISYEIPICLLTFDDQNPTFSHPLWIAWLGAAGGVCERCAEPWMVDQSGKSTQNSPWKYGC